MTWQMTRSIPSFPRVVVLLISYSQYTKRKIRGRTLYARPLVVFSSPLVLHAVLVRPVALALCGGPWHLR